MDVAQQFGLRADPFAPPAGGGETVEGVALVRARDELLARLRNGERLAVVLGESGSGRSALLRAAAGAVSADGLSVEHVVHAQQLERALAGDAEVLMVDEADTLDDATLQALIAAAESPRRKAVVMSALPGGVARLNVPVQPVRLRRLSPAEAREFLLAHVERVGGPRALFEPGALEAIVEAAHGSPRLLRSLGASALLEATLDGAAHVGELHARRAVGMQLRTGKLERPRAVAPPAVAESTTPWVGAGAAHEADARGREVADERRVEQGPAPRAEDAQVPAPAPAPVPVTPVTVGPSVRAEEPVVPVGAARRDEAVPPAWPPPSHAAPARGRVPGLLPLFLGAALAFALTPVLPPLVGAPGVVGGAERTERAAVGEVEPEADVRERAVEQEEVAIAPPEPERDLARVEPEPLPEEEVAAAEALPPVAPEPEEEVVDYEEEAAPPPLPPREETASRDAAAVAAASDPEPREAERGEEPRPGTLRPAFTRVEEGKRVFVHYAPEQEGARALAEHVAEQLEARGWTVEEVREVGIPVRTASARYFYDRDRYASRALDSEVERLLNARGVEGGSRLIAMTDYRPLPRPGTLEVWVPGRR